MRPNSAELLKGIQGSLMTYVLPEVQSDYARSGLMLTQVLLGIAANDFDGAAQDLVDDNAASRALAGHAADVLDNHEVTGQPALAGELRALAGGTDPSVRVSALTEANEQLQQAIAALGVSLEGSATPEHEQLRRAVIAHLHKGLERLPHDLMGSRADG